MGAQEDGDAARRGKTVGVTVIGDEDTVLLTGAELAAFMRDVEAVSAPLPDRAPIQAPWPSSAYQARIAAARAAMEEWQ